MSDDTGKGSAGDRSKAGIEIYSGGMIGEIGICAEPSELKKRGAALDSLEPCLR